MRLGNLLENAGASESVNMARQHEIIVSDLEEFTAKVYASADKQILIDLMHDLLADISMHFGYEESLMESGAYPGFDHHRRQHLGMITEIGLVLDRLANLQRADHDLLRRLDFLTEWFRRHTETNDAELIAWLGAAGA